MNLSDLSALVVDFNPIVRINKFISKVNEYSRHGIPFIFIVDFEFKKPIVQRLQKISSTNLLYYVNGFTNADKEKPIPKIQVDLQSTPISWSDYQDKFDAVRKHLDYGDSFLTNLTIKTEINTDQSLRDLFLLSKAKYKCWVKDEFLVFSPETFIRIKNGRIYSYPMKGTIDAGIPDAEKIITTDPKELAEHVTIVDLIRNDLSQVAINVGISRFRYIDKIRTNRKNLLQVSTEISGTLEADYQSKLGDILVALLPAGSVSGAPKSKTIEIIREAEKEDRGYYTGVSGFFDGQNLDSGVMIRYIEKKDGKYFYRSGGGITTQSDCMKEYEEAINKIYVPVD